ncbi:unnamed protein product [Linum tenue]|uniref:Uncharacterized protein n=1 Tax=Linum tenue TaxID=586396 RepID=A0AAV0RRY9_9ROSI|nr:unnamed protein product [Linum tenue]
MFSVVLSSRFCDESYMLPLCFVYSCCLLLLSFPTGKRVVKPSKMTSKGLPAGMLIAVWGWLRKMELLLQVEAATGVTFFRIMCVRS